MVKIAQLASYNINIGDNIAIYNIRRVLSSLVDDEIFWIWSIYSNKPDSNVGMVESFKIATDLAKQKKCKC